MSARTSGSIPAASAPLSAGIAPSRAAGNANVVVCRVERVHGHERRAEAVGLAQRHVQLRTGKTGLRREHPRRVQQDAGLLGHGAGEDPRVVGEKDHRQPERPYGVEKARGLLRRVAVDRSGPDPGVVGHHRHRRAAEAEESGHHRAAEGRLDLEHLPVVGDQLDDATDVVGAAGIGRDQVQDLVHAAPAVADGTCRRGEHRVRGEVGEVPPDQRKGCDVVGDRVVHHARERGVHRRTAELLLGQLLAGRRRDERRSGAEQRASLDHHREVHQRRGERTVPGAGAHHHRDRRHAATEPGERLEVVGRVRVALERVLGPLPRSLQQHDERHLLLFRQLRQPMALGMGADADGAPHDAEVLRPDEHRPALDQAVTRDQAVRGGDRGHAPTDAADERTELPEGPRVEQRADPGASVEPAPFVLARQPLGAAHLLRGVPSLREILQQRVPVAHRSLARAVLTPGPPWTQRPRPRGRRRCRSACRAPRRA